MTIIAQIFMYVYFERRSRQCVVQHQRSSTHVENRPRENMSEKSIKKKYDEKLNSEESRIRERGKDEKSSDIKTLYNQNFSSVRFLVVVALIFS